MIARRKAKAAARAGYRSLAFRVLYLAAAVWLLFTYGFLITQCSGQGMFPAVKDGDLSIVFRSQAMQLFGQGLAKNDIVVYQAQGQRRFGRVVAVAGDVIVFDESGGITVNGVTGGQEILFPTYAREGQESPYRVPDGSVYVLGDYRTNTLDSRDFGPIPLQSVEGKVITLLRRRGL